MTTIPRQRQPGRRTCPHCGEPLALRNRQLGPVYEHDGGSDLCADAPVGAGVGASERGGR